MIKYFLVFTLFVLPGLAKMLDAVAMTVNGEPITLYEIKAFSQKAHITKEDAVNALIQEKIELEQMQKQGIFATPDEINQRIAMIAKQNHLTSEQFRTALQKEGKSLSSLKRDIAKQIKKEKLYQKILSGKLKKPTENEMLDYYSKHQKAFTIPGKISVLEYLSSDPRALQAIQMQPMLMLPNVKVTPKKFDPVKTNPQLVQLLLQTPNKTFTPIVNLGKNKMAMFFVQSKGKAVTAPYDQVKQNIFMKIMKDQEQANLIAYFEKKKSEADIKVLRKP